MNSPQASRKGLQEKVPCRNAFLTASGRLSYAIIQKIAEFSLGRSRPRPYHHRQQAPPCPPGHPYGA
jgi:hypothetical protein